MYLTFFINSAKRQLTWDDILNDPYLTTDTKTGKKKITKVISDEYAEQLWNKRNVKNMPVFAFTPADDFKTENHYRHFQIPKKSNPHKMRQIDAPDDELSQYQEWFKNYIENYNVSLL